MYDKEPFHKSIMFRKVKDGSIGEEHPGASLHDWYVGMALQGIIAHHGLSGSDSLANRITVMVSQANECADEVMKQREQAKD